MKVSPNEKLATCVEIVIKQECLEKFITATIKKHEKAINEQGNIQFDVLQSKKNECFFLLYEVYENAS